MLLRRCFKGFIYAIAIIVIAFAVLINAARLMIPVLSLKNNFFERWASYALNQPVHIGQVSTGWYGFDPALTFKDVTLMDSENKTSLLHIDRLSIGVDVFHSLLHRQLLPGHLALSGTTVNIYEGPDGKFGLQAGGNSQQNIDIAYAKNILFWMATQSDVYLNHINIYYHAINNQLVPVENLRLRVTNNVLRHQIVGAATLKKAETIPSAELQRQQLLYLYLQSKINPSQKHDGRFRFVLDFKDVQKEGLPKAADLYVEANQVNFHSYLEEMLLQKYFHPIRVTQGLANVQLWAKWREGHLETAQTVLSGEHVAVQLAEGKPAFLINQMQGKLLWQHYADGWQLSANQLKDTINGRPWPEHDFDLRWIDKPNALPTILFKTDYVQLEDVYALAKEIGYWPANLQAFEPQGHLSHLFLMYALAQSGWQLTVPTMEFSDNNMNWRGSFALQVAQNQSPILNTDFRVDIKNVAKLRSYLPHDKKTELFTWLDQAFLKGALNDGKISFHGPLKDWADHFDFEGKVNQVTLHFAPRWPNLENIQGTLSVHHHEMTIVADHAAISGNPLDHLVAKMDLEKPLLTIVGHSSTELSQALNFMHESPLVVAKQMEGMAATGPMDLQLKLDIRLGKKITANSDGTITVRQGHLQLVNWGTRLSQVNGQFHFQDHRLQATGIKALFYGMPTTVDIATIEAPKASSALQFKINGVLDPKLLMQQFKSSILQDFSGKTTYQALLQIHNEESLLGNQLHLSSDLKGLRSTLSMPTPAARELQPLSVDAAFYPKKPLQIKLNYGANFSAAVSVDQTATGWSLVGGEIHFGPGEAHYQTLPGLLVTAKLDRLDGVVWKEYLSSLWKGAGSKNSFSSFNLRAAEFYIGELYWNQYSFADNYFSVTPNKNGWTLTMQNPIVSGHVRIPREYEQIWRGHFSRLYLLPGKKSAEPIDPRTLPPVRLTVDDLRYNRKQYGHIHIETSRLLDGLKIDNLSVNTPILTLQSSGAWQVIQDKQKTTLVGSLASSDLGTVLKNWDITQVLVGGKGKANFALNWPDSPKQFSAGTLSGDVKFIFHDGRVTHLSQNTESELGLGKLLNLFSLQSIPLLPLNVVHLTQKGFRFSAFSGDVTLTNGTGNTKEIALVGPVAWVKISGSVGFAQRNCDLRLDIVPNMTASLPLVVGLAGGPIAGAIAWVADKILAHQVGKAAQMNYRVSGSWDKPTVAKISNSQARKTQSTENK